MKLKVKNVLLALAASAMLISGCSGNGSPKGSEDVPASELAGTSINVYNWGDYIDEEVLDIFTEETGITVNYDYFDSNEIMYAKIKNSGASYDVAFPSDYMITKMIAEDMLLKLDFNNIPNYEYIDDKFKNLDFDPNNEYSVPYMWGTLGILYNTDMVDDEVNSWNILWNEKYKGEIFMYSSQRDAFVPALRLLGYSVNTTNIDELNEAKELLINQMPLVQAYVGDPVKDKMIGNEGALALVYSGDAIYCQEYNENLEYVIPDEGSNAWFDNVVIPSTAKNKAGAEAFINFLCRPDIAQKNTEYIGYSTTNKEVAEELGEEFLNNPVYWPSDEIFDELEVFVDLGDFIQEFDKAWTEVLTASSK
ncbi:ABC transporter substrate-binding protein [Anaeropeptidivorans aminofermentans]|uniref:ABC transporter substrate-binding protein n=1 Tax=Anaeropeptidivorans aminofermentans TaxID=2934315 RepID=UPI00202566D2|nr:spermidine/putrescine ABC transporter substrate-binding protein [Anaeropeptidivorans aminofermentans]MBE6013018.1 spermidine/putrescine ABC transporter substrate-binding protein [Lachnospiraceae bacterium]